MAKKTVKKTTKKVKETNKDDVREVLIENLIIHVNELMGKVVSINKRIDAIVDAHERCKSLKGL